MALVVVAAALAGPPVAGARTPPAGGGRTPAGFTVGALPPAPASGVERNAGYEPAIATAPDGTLWIAADSAFDRRRGLGGLVARPDDPLLTLAATDIWRSTDGGRSFRWVAAPFNPIAQLPGTGGDDAEIAVAPDRNRNGFHNLYAASLWTAEAAGLGVGEVSLALSQDGGRTWLMDPVAATMPLDDRQWLTADGACTVYMTYHGAANATTTTSRFDLCDAADLIKGQTVDALESTRVVHFAPSAIQNKPEVYVLGDFGKPAIDLGSRSRFRHNLYVPALDCDPLRFTDELSREGAEQECRGLTQVYVQSSADGGATWTLHHAGQGVSGDLPLWGIHAAVDDAGALYLIWFDNRHAYLIVSRDGGRTFGPRRQIDTGRVRTVAYPAIAVSGRRDVRIAFYGTRREGSADDTKAMGLPGTPGAAVWKLYTARSRDGGRTFSEPTALTKVHTGAVCTQGDRCDLFSGVRDLWDVLDMTISPTTRATAIAYTSDQPQSDIYHLFAGVATGR